MNLGKVCKERKSRKHFDDQWRSKSWRVESGVKSCEAIPIATQGSKRQKHRKHHRHHQKQHHYQHHEQYLHQHCSIFIATQKAQKAVSDIWPYMSSVIKYKLYLGENTICISDNSYVLQWWQTFSSSDMLRSVLNAAIWEIWSSKLLNNLITTATTTPKIVIITAVSEVASLSSWPGNTNTKY